VTVHKAREFQQKRAWLQRDLNRDSSSPERRSRHFVSLSPDRKRKRQGPPLITHRPIAAPLSPCASGGADPGARLACGCGVTADVCTRFGERRASVWSHVAACVAGPWTTRCTRCKHANTPVGSIGSQSGVRMWGSGVWGDKGRVVGKEHEL
jgi:hypothetical protein